MTTRIALSLAAAALIAAPAVAQGATQSQGGQDGNRQEPKQMSQGAQACLEQLQQVDQRLAEYGYGRVGPEGYGNYGGAYRTPGDTGAATGTAEPTPGMAGAGRLTSPRADMQTLLRAGYIMALQDEAEGCQSVLQTAQDIGNRYQQALKSGDIDREALQEWRGEYLATAVPVSEAKQPMSIEQIVGSDVRNLQDEDLGDVEDVVLGAGGGIQYVLISRGGFLGIGEDRIPVRWEDLRVTADPYRDTLVLDVEESALENAPRVQSADRSGLVTDEARQQEIEQYWQQTGLGDAG